MTWVALAAGIVLLLGGGEALVRGSVAVASRLGVSPLVIGLTLVGFGTSTPELVASLQAALIGAPAIAIGNVVGSNTANILLILGISALIMPVATTKQAFRRDGTVLIVAALLLVAAVLSGTVARWMGLVFLVLLAAYTIYSYRTERLASDGPSQVHAAQADEMATRSMSLAMALLMALGGIVGVVFGANLLIDAAVEIALTFGLSEAVIGLTLVSVGTSLPELATAAVASYRRHGDVSFGNIVGSNIFNSWGIAGTTALVVPIPVAEEIIRFDIWIMLATTLLLVVFAVTGWRVSRREGAVFLAAYAAYLTLLLAPGMRQSLGLL